MWSSDQSRGKDQDTAQDAQPTAVPAPKHRHKHHVQPDGTRVWEDEKTWEDEGGKGWGRVWMKRWERGPNKEKEQENVQTGNVMAATSLAGNPDDQTTSTAAITAVSPEHEQTTTPTATDKKNRVILDKLLHESYRSGYSDALSSSRLSQPFGFFGFPGLAAFDEPFFAFPPAPARILDEDPLVTSSPRDATAKVYSYSSTSSGTGTTVVAALLAGTAAVLAWKTHKRAKGLDKALNEVVAATKARGFGYQGGRGGNEVQQLNAKVEELNQVIRELREMSLSGTATVSKELRESRLEAGKVLQELDKEKMREKGKGKGKDKEEPRSAQNQSQDQSQYLSAPHSNSAKDIITEDAMPISDIHQEVEKIKGQFLNDAPVSESNLSGVSGHKATDSSTKLQPQSQSLSPPASDVAASTEAEPLPTSPSTTLNPPINPLASKSLKAKSSPSLPPFIPLSPNVSGEVIPLDDIHKEVEAIKQRFLIEDQKKDVDVDAYELSGAVNSGEQQAAFLTDPTGPKVSTDGDSESSLSCTKKFAKKTNQLITQDHTAVLEASSSSTISELPSTEIPGGNAVAGVRGNKRTVYIETKTKWGAPTIVTETVQPVPPVGKWYFFSSPSIVTQSSDATPVIPFDQGLKPKSPFLPPNVVLGPGRQEKITLIKRKTTEEVVKGVMQDVESVKIRIPGKKVYDRAVVGRDEVRTWEISTTILLAKDDRERGIVKLDGKWWDAKLVSVNADKGKDKVGSEGAVAIWTLGV
ncbi:hypothetical protein J010_06469 [Cryptococcus neoformans]|nr:hypothetical protein C355_06485 [Cryptococcus neoformans var. grubii Th84]OXH01002.1 hypothetical protein J010_06469 [Cryptococcus neoformans var. grubii]OXH22942.1 hypothetical protein J009_06457 [Cryptococcus neoformans var. grubii]OXH42804.1 hypothetical protein J004_06481 [Cryptococcus neoformans var. grubii]OXH43479.1 hypothetical protein J003_06450 [Cryptococcus neoformans var. grubii]